MNEYEKIVEFIKKQRADGRAAFAVVTTESEIIFVADHNDPKTEKLVLKYE